MFKKKSLNHNIFSVTYTFSENVNKPDIFVKHFISDTGYGKKIILWGYTQKLKED